VAEHNEILAPRAEGESNKKYKRRRLMAVLDYVRTFYLEHGHSRIPEGAATVGGTDACHFWLVLRGSRSEALPQYVKDAMEELAAIGVDTRPEPPAKRKKVRENLAPPEQMRCMPYLQAIAAFAERHGHTNIPGHVVSRVGELKYGVTANAWRRARAAGVLNPWLTRKLEEIPEWTWTVAEESRSRGKVVLPADTTRMRRSGLRQFLPED
jgi:hypothetical protein